MRYKNIIALTILSVALYGCLPETKMGEQLKEDGEVYDTCFIPKGHGSDTAIGFNTSGDISVTPINIDIPARYAIVFKCQHGKFVIDGDRGEALYKKLSKGDIVKIKYCEKLLKLENGTWHAIDLHFIDADKAKE